MIQSHYGTQQSGCFLKSVSLAWCKLHLIQPLTDLGPTLCMNMLQVKQIAGAVAETLGSGAQALRSSIPFMRNRGAEYNPLMSMDPGEMDLDPEFVSSAPFRSGAHSAPGTAGSYHQFVDVRQPSGSAGGVVWSDFLYLCVMDWPHVNYAVFRTRQSPVPLQIGS